MILTLVMAFSATILTVGLKANQNLSVHYGRYALILPSSMMLGAVDYFMINTIVASSPWIIVATGLGGAVGCILAMNFDKWWRKRYE